MAAALRLSRLETWISLALLLPLLCGAALFSVGCVPGEDDSGGGGASGGGTSGALMERITLSGKPYTLEVARDNAAREKGLGGRAEIPADGGMLFVFDDSQLRRFFMRDCTIDLDIVFLDPLGFVTAVHTMPKEPPRGTDESIDRYLARLKLYSSISPAQFAIELRSGEAAKLGIKPNQRIEHDWKRVRKLTR